VVAGANRHDSPLLEGRVPTLLFNIIKPEHQIRND
jgi:hypothetical protein